MNHEVTIRLLVILTCFAALAFAGTRKWLRPLETAIVGIAMIFWATGWLMSTLLPIAVGTYGRGTHALLIAGAMTLPMTLSMSVGLVILVRRMRKRLDNPPTPPSPPSRKKKRG